MTIHSENLIWIDLEMTGLDTFNDSIIEIATIVTDKHLNILAEGPVYAIQTPEEVLDGMDEWNTRQHGQSGLVERIRTSGVSMDKAEQDTIEFLTQYVPAGASPMCGNSICQDRRFMARLMPDLEAYFHYRNLDVSTLKELASRWRPEVLSGFSKKGSHLAMDDVRESIAEMLYYRQNFLRMK
ncbi:MAG: oligoribonuclease [Gammaproteobacteria bacterium]|nr:oligoribonuclease [Gammaproteobacteria bacterium]